MKILIYSFLCIASLSFAQTDAINKIIESKIAHNSETPVHSMLFYFENENFSYNEGFGRVNRKGDTISKNTPFKIASSTKLFVATIMLQLEEAGKLSLNDKVSQYLNDIDYLKFEDFHILNGKKHATEITIKQLLSHRSGLADIFTDREESFFSLLIQNPNKQYTPKAIIELYFQFNLNKEPHFKPNEGWHYSDMNYVLLGLIIEKIDKTALSQSIRNRILEPLKMENTFFEFYEAPQKALKPISQYVGNINFLDINTSFDWAGGGLVSTNKDLAIFIKALFNFKLINKESVTKMIDVKLTKDHESRYGLGVYEFIINKNVYYGHFGFYNTFVGYCPETKSTLSYCISQTNPDFNTYELIDKLLRFVE
ncbi:serine hydrolase domain-containing protein [Thalassobellus citreus]|uniref:serine hydrolase domain-containing protein n=1 Tax=Thalassobellus citreus TaxID=3367752 RepID=UPI003794A6F3